MDQKKSGRGFSEAQPSESCRVASCYCAVQRQQGVSGTVTGKRRHVAPLSGSTCHWWLCWGAGGLRLLSHVSLCVGGSLLSAACLRLKGHPTFTVDTHSRSCECMFYCLNILANHYNNSGSSMNVRSVFRVNVIFFVLDLFPVLSCPQYVQDSCLHLRIQFEEQNLHWQCGCSFTAAW